MASEVADAVKLFRSEVCFANIVANLTSLYTFGVKHHCALAQHHFERSEKHHRKII